MDWKTMLAYVTGSVDEELRLSYTARGSTRTTGRRSRINRRGNVNGRCAGSSLLATRNTSYRCTDSCRISFAPAATCCEPSTIVASCAHVPSGFGVR